MIKEGKMRKKYKRNIFIIFWLIIVLYPIYGQVNQSHSVAGSFLQLKDQHNLGMVFNGVQLEYRYGLIWKIQDHEIMYQPKIAFGIAFNREVTGGQVKIAPVNVYWIMPFYEQSRHTIKGGFNFITDYSYQVYPDLNSGNVFWSSEIGVSPIVQYQFQWDNKRIGIGLQNSLFGFTSHTQKIEPYFFEFHLYNAGDYFKKPHENMQFGSFNKYNHTIFSLEFVPNIQRRHSFIYEFDYFGTFYGVQFNRINHSLIWKASL